MKLDQKPPSTSKSSSQNSSIVAEVLRMVGLGPKEQKQVTKDSQPTKRERKPRLRPFQGYTPLKEVTEERFELEPVEAEEIKEEKVIARRARLDTIKDLNLIGFFEKINLVNHHMALESGKIDERLVMEEYRRNSELLKKENTLKYFLLEVGARNLVYGEFPVIKIQIDPRLQDELYTCMQSKLLSQYKIEIEEEDEILTKLEVRPIIISMRLP